MPPNNFTVLQNDVEEAKQRLDLLDKEMTSQVAELQEKLQILKDEKNSEIEELESSKSSLESELQSKTIEMEEFAAANERLLNERNSLKSSFHETESLLETKKEELATYVSRIEAETLLGASRKEEVVGLSTENENLQQELNKRQSLVSDLVTDCMRLKNELAVKKDECESNEREIATLLSRSNSLLALKAQYETNENHLKSELADKDRVIHKQQDEVEEYRSEYQTLLREFGATSLPDLQAILTAYVDEIKALKHELHIKDKDINDLKAAEGDLLKLRDDLTEQIQKLESDLEEYKHSLQDSQKEVAELLRRSSSLEESNYHFQEDLDESRKRWESEKTGFLFKLQEEESKSKDAHLLASDYQKQLHELNDQIQAFQNELQRYESENLRLQELLQKNQNLLEQERNLSAPVKEKITKLKDEFLCENSIFSQMISNSQPNLTLETYQQSANVTSGQDQALEFIEKQLKELDVVLRRNASNDVTEERVNMLQSQLMASNEKLQEQATQVSSCFVCAVFFAVHMYSCARS